MIRDFFKDESGSITVGLSIIFPLLVLFMLFTEIKWQAHYIRLETQAILDFATLGAATTGETSSTSDGLAVCYIPYNADKPENSGVHVAQYLIKENSKMLPDVLQSEFSSMISNNEFEGMTNWNNHQSGFMSLKANFSYRNPMHILFNKYVFNIESTAKCHPYFADE